MSLIQEPLNRSFAGRRPIQIFSRHGSGGDYFAEMLSVASGTYEAVYALPASLTTPPIADLNSCAMAPVTYRIYCGVQIGTGSSKWNGIVLVSDQSSPGTGYFKYIARTTSHGNSATFDRTGTFWLKNGQGIYKIDGLDSMPRYDDISDPGILDLTEEWSTNAYKVATGATWGADMIDYDADLEGSGSATYLVSLAGFTARLIRTDTYAKFTLDTVAAPGSVLPSNANPQFGSAWNYQGQIFFAENSGQGVYEVTITQTSFSAGDAILRRIGSAAPTSLNDGTNCMDAAIPCVAGSTRATPSARPPAVLAWRSILIHSPPTFTRPLLPIVCSAPINMC